MISFPITHTNKQLKKTLEAFKKRTTTISPSSINHINTLSGHKKVSIGMQQGTHYRTEQTPNSSSIILYNNVWNEPTPAPPRKHITYFTRPKKEMPQ